ncbi:MAG TPA: zinc-binding dehydrogenase, partial [Trueperaceae bacterium]|nr:zinc-binding dehydrogenase [Trueperaceae bacterium]
FGAMPIIAVDVSDAKLEAARGLGATHVVNSRKENAVERIRAITGGRGVDVSFEALGRPETFASALDSVRDGGRAVMVGIAPAGVTAPIEITRLVRRKIAVTGSYGGRTRTDMPAVVSLAKQGLVDVRAPITRRYPLEEAEDAYQALNAGEIVGRAIIVMEA